MPDPDGATVVVAPQTVQIVEVARPSRRRFQLAGVALIVYGIVGIVIFALVAFGTNRPLQRAGDLSQAVDDDLAAVVELLDQTETTIRDMSTSVTHVDGSLANAQGAVARSSDIALGLSVAMYGLRDAMGISIFGAQPLIGLAGRFGDTGTQLEALSTDLATVSTSLGVNRADVASTADNLVVLADRVAKLSDTIDATPSLAIAPTTLNELRLGIYAVLGWLMLLAAGCVVLGVYLISMGRGHSAPSSI